LAEDEQFDLAILDVNLKGKLSFPVADIIMRRRIPLIFATGYAADSFPDAYRATPCLRKPFEIDALAHAITVAIDHAPN
jgi:CheY-like chemotaxis protein